MTKKFGQRSATRSGRASEGERIQCSHGNRGIGPLVDRLCCMGSDLAASWRTVAIPAPGPNLLRA